MKTLLNKLYEWANSLRENELESYIASRNPKDAADIDYIIREYCYRNKSGWL